MSENRVVALRRKGAIDDPLTEIYERARVRLIAQAVEAEFETFLASNAELVLADGRQRVVRHGHDPVRAIQTGIGPVEVQKPKARDRGATTGARIRFTSNILPKWARRTKSLDALLPVLYLRGISAGDFQEALTALLGKDAPNLSPAVIARLRNAWEDEYRRWQDRDLSARHYVYVWADGIYLQARMTFFDFPADHWDHLRTTNPIESVFATVRHRTVRSLFDISLTVSPIKDEKGEIVGASKIGRDITQLKRARGRQGLLLREMDHRVENSVRTGDQRSEIERPLGRQRPGTSRVHERSPFGPARAHALTLSSDVEIFRKQQNRQRSILSFRQSQRLMIFRATRTLPSFRSQDATWKSRGA